MYQQGYAPVMEVVTTVVEAVQLPVQQRARPLFPGGDMKAANAIRGYYEPCCCGMRPGTGPNVPPHWYDGGKGWVTAHFFDLEPFDFNAQNPGRHQCKYCGYIADGEECCGKGACWCPLARAPWQMEAHLATSHGIAPPPRRQWATECTDSRGLCDACFCWQCLAARMIMAKHGWANEFNAWWCLYFTCAGGSHYDDTGRRNHVACHVLAAWMTRNAIKELHNIDEDCCTTILMACCCPVCSLAQTYREFSAGGVWPGGVCQDAPPVVTMDMPPPHLMGGAGYAPMGGQGGEYGKLM